MEERLNRLVVIKTIGCTMLLTGLAAYYFSWDVVALFTVENPNGEFIETFPDFDEQIANARRDALPVLIPAGVLLVLAGTCAFGILNVKRWALIAFHALSLVLVLLLAGAMIVDFFSDDQLPFFRTINLAKEGTLLIILGWILTRIKILLLRTEYRSEFH